MPSIDELILTLRMALSSGKPLIDAQVARQWQSSLQRAVGSSVADGTDYLHGRSYCYDWTLLPPFHPYWQTVARIRISASGPFVTHTCLQTASVDRWWGGAIRTGRNGFVPEHGPQMHRLRIWYQECGLQLLDPETQGALLPSDLLVPGDRTGTPTLFTGLFGS